MNKRVLFLDNDNLRDLSTTVTKYSPTEYEFQYTANRDALFIGSRLPFNHVYFKIGRKNINPAVMKVEYYSNGWNQVAEVIDETEGFTKSGFVTFVPKKSVSWQMSEESSKLEGLENSTIYDLYWLKITFDADFDPSTGIIWCGNLFSDDIYLGVEYPDLLKPAVIANFKTGKRDWEEQAVKAAEILVEDLIKKAIIDDGAQILNREDYKNASVCKVAEIIYGSFGDDFLNERLNARKEYEQRLAKRVHKVDLNADATENVGERKTTSGWLSR